MSAVQFTVLIRLPFARGDFVDPPQVRTWRLHPSLVGPKLTGNQADWNAAKDRELWKAISKSSKTSDLNCACFLFFEWRFADFHVGAELYVPP